MTIANIKTRFAPSPTGFLHLGNVRTALFSALLARRWQGIFLLRIEDTDRERSRAEYVDALLDDLRWLGLQWQEGPERGGPQAPYAQSEREAIYEEYYGQLEDTGRIYPCFCTPTELTVSRKAQLAAGRPPRYSGTCARLSPADRRARLERGLSPSLRFQVPNGQTVEFTDLVRGPQRFASDDIGDFVIRRADGTPQFFFANAVDDALMGVTHVLRGEDHLTNTPRQVLLLEALGLPVPHYGHLALIVGSDGGPLSKRSGDLSVRELRAQGYLPEVLLNYLARLGHSYEQDTWLNVNELAAGFSPDHLGRAPARFDEAHLLHWQAEGVQRATYEQLWDWVGTGVRDQVPEEVTEAFIATVRPNIRFPADALFWAERFFGVELARSVESETAITAAGSGFFGHALAAYDQYGADYPALTANLRERTGLKGKPLFMPLRAAMTGETHGPELARILALLPAETIRRRLQACC